jgi:hypothetical protein
MGAATDAVGRRGMTGTGDEVIDGAIVGGAITGAGGSEGVGVASVQADRSATTSSAKTLHRVGICRAGNRFIAQTLAPRSPYRFEGIIPPLTDAHDEDRIGNSR